MFESGTVVEGIILVSLSQFLPNQSLKMERERERGRGEDISVSSVISWPKSESTVQIKQHFKVHHTYLVCSVLLALSSSDVSFLQQSEGALLPPPAVRRRRGEREES